MTLPYVCTRAIIQTRAFHIVMSKDKFSTDVKCRERRHLLGHYPSRK